MATVNTLGADVLSLRGADEEYHRISRFFRTRAEAEAALVSEDWVPMAGVVNVCITGDEGILLYDADDTVNGMLSNLDGPARTYIDSQISTLVGDSPDLLNTLSEISDALGDDPQFVTTITNRLDDIEDGYDFTGAISAPVAGSVIPFFFADQTAFPDATDNHGAIVHSHADGAMYFAHDGTWHELALAVDLRANTNTTNALVQTVGVADGDVNLGTFTGTTINDGATVKEALQSLETTLEAVDIDTDDMATLVGLSENVTNLGGFTGSTITDGTDIKGALQDLETAVEANDAALDGRLDILEADATTQTAVDNLELKVDNNESDIEDKISDVNNALGINVGDTEVTFTEDLIVVELDASRSTDHVGIYSDITTGGPDAGQTLDIKTALERFAANSRIVLAAEKHRMDAEDARLDAVIGSTGSDLGTFTGSTISDNENVKDALQALETATEGEINARTAITEFTSNLTKLKNDLRGTYINVGNNIELRASAGGRVEIVGDLYLDNNTAINGSGTTLTSFENINAYDGRLNTLEADATTQTALDAVQADVDQNEADADAAIALKADKAGDTFTGVVTVQDHLIVDDSNNAATDYNFNVKSSGSSVFGVLGNGAVLLGNNSGAPFIASSDHHATSKKYVDDAISALVDAAPGTLNTLNELAAALGDDANFSTTITDMVNANETHVDNLATLTGVAKDATVLGAFSGSTLADNETIKDALQDLETAVESKLDASDVSTFGGTLIDDADAAAARTTLGVDAAGTDNSTDVTLAGHDYITISGQEITADHVDLTDDVTGILPISNGGTGAGTAANALIALGLTATAAEINALDGITATVTELNYTDGVTSNIQTQLNAIQADVDQNESDADSAIALKLDASAVSTFGGTLIDDADAATARTTLGLGSAATTDSGDYATAAQGATADAALPAAGAQAALSVDHLITLSGVAEAADDLGTFSGSTISDSGTVKAALQELETAVEATPAEATAATTVKTQVAANSANYYLTFVDSNNVANTAEALRTGAGIKYNPSTNILDIASGTVHAQYLTIANVNLNATATELNVLDGITATTAELNYTDGVTSNIQTQLDAKAATTDLTAATDDISDIRSVTGTNDGSTHLGTFSGSTITDNVAIKTALQELETAQEATQADVDQNESDADAAIAAVLAGTSIPGPYNNDSDAATGGVAVGAIYKNSNGSIHWRVS